MAQSMKGEGVIMPVEVDPSFKIICGEMRWRAAKIAGLKEIPCIINAEKLTPMERMMRQCIENAHHSDMSIMDTARAWEKLILASSRLKRTNNDKGMTWLASQLGISVERISQVLQMLKESKQIQTFVNKPENAHLPSYFHEVSRVKDKSLGDQMRKKILKGDFGTREEAREAIRAVTKYPKRAGDILGCFTKDGVKRELENITGELPRIIKADHPNKLANRADMYIFRLERDLEEILKIVATASPAHQRKVVASLLRLHDKIGRFIKSAKIKKLQ